MDVASSKATRSSLVTSPPTSASYAAQNIAEAACRCATTIDALKQARAVADRRANPGTV